MRRLLGRGLAAAAMLTMALGALPAAAQSALQDVLNSGALGEFSLTLDLTAIPTSSGTTAAMAGQTFNFQAWFRDVNPTPTSNFTDGLSILFQ